LLRSHRSVVVWTLQRRQVLTMKISGYTYCRNAVDLDYCVGLTIESLSRCCDEVVVCDSDSTDTTKDLLGQIAARNPKVRVINMPWENPVGDIAWFTRWIQFTRKHLSNEYQLCLDADEIMDYDQFNEYRSNHDISQRPIQFNRLNYWRDVNHLIPPGRCCAHLVTRFGSSTYYMPSDEQYGDLPNQLPGKEPEIRLNAVKVPINIHHVGFLRQREALFKKCEVCLRAFFNTWDERLDQAKAHPEVHWTTFCQFDRPLIEYAGGYPEIAHDWLKERGAI
jgi:glycosyltransferase involved in cell wall biosynthesis